MKTCAGLGAALREWLAGYERKKTCNNYLRAVTSLWSFSRKLPWEVRHFYKFAGQKSWISPTGRQIPLCQSNPAEGIWPSEPLTWYPKVEPLSEADLERLLAAFDLETP
jgi:hypothetical protein